jgi:hypothetical protein
MSLAFALMAAINGSTGSSATLSHGLKGTKPRRRQSTAARILIPHRWRRKPSRTLSENWMPGPQCGRRRGPNQRLLMVPSHFSHEVRSIRRNRSHYL